MTAPYRGGPSGQYDWKGMRPSKGRMWSYTYEDMLKLEEGGRIVYTRTAMPRLKNPVEELRGLPLQDVWAKPERWLNSGAKEGIGDIYISVIPFETDVNVGASNVNASWLRWDSWDPSNYPNSSSPWQTWCSGG